MMQAIFIGGLTALLAVLGFFLSDKAEAPSTETTGTEFDEDDTEGSTSEKSAAIPASSFVTVDLSGQGLTQVPNSVFEKTETVVLNLSNNQLGGALQAEVRQLSKLRELDLSNNNFTGVPAEVGQLSKLEILNLSGNPITGLPYELGNLGNLHLLDLRGTNYATQDLDIIKKTLPASVQILVD